MGDIQTGLKDVTAVWIFKERRAVKNPDDGEICRMKQG